MRVRSDQVALYKVIHTMRVRSDQAALCKVTLTMRVRSDQAALCKVTLIIQLTLFILDISPLNRSALKIFFKKARMRISCVFCDEILLKLLRCIPSSSKGRIDGLIPIKTAQSALFSVNGHLGDCIPVTTAQMRLILHAQLIRILRRLPRCV